MNGNKARALRKYAGIHYKEFGYKNSRPLYKALKKGYKLGKVTFSK